MIRPKILALKINVAGGAPLSSKWRNFDNENREHICQQWIHAC
jgi:hypothetical protein